MSSKKMQDKTGSNKKSVKGFLLFVLVFLSVSAFLSIAVIFSLYNFGQDIGNLGRFFEREAEFANVTAGDIPHDRDYDHDAASSQAPANESVSSELPEGYIKLKEISPLKSKYFVEAGSTIDIKAKFTPSKATDKELIWSSDDDSVAVVNSFGKVTGKFPGECNIKAVSKVDPSVFFDVPLAVVRVGEYPSDAAYLLKVYKGSQSVVAYKKDSYGQYTVEEKILTCSTGASKTPTKSGTYKTINKYRWRLMMGPSYGQYATSFSSDYLFHSVPCSAQKPNTMSMGGYLRLGTPASHGCVRLSVIDAKWIYDNCGLGTPVEVVNESGPKGPAPVPLNWKFSGWDPTDPDPKSPYNK